MKLKRKVIRAASALAIAANIVLSAQIPAFAKYSYSDIASTIYRPGIETLSQLGILGGYESGEFRPEDAMTRAEFLEIILRIKNQENVKAQRLDRFSDVPEKHWAADMINYAFETGMIAGNDGLFRPDDGILYEEAVKMTLDMLGYAPAAAEKGGYPAGYLSLASQNNLGKNISAYTGTVLTRAEAAQMFYNALDVSVMSPTTKGTDSYEVEKGVTLLEKYKNITKYKGMITAVPNASLYDEDGVADGKVSINGILYETDCGDINNYLGYTVYYYVEDADDDAKILAFEVIDKYNEVFEVPAENVIDAEQASDNSIVLKYYKQSKEDGRQGTLKISATADVLYNGQALPDFTREDLFFDNGKISFIKSDRDDKYDVVSISSYITYVADSVSRITKTVACKDSDEKISLDTDKFDVKIIKNGVGIELEDIKEWDILSIAASRSDSAAPKRTVIVSDTYIDAAAAGYDDEYITIDDVQYKCVRDRSVDVQLGIPGRFYLDYEGKIAAVDYKRASEGNLGFLMNVRNVEEEDCVYIKLYTDGEFLNYKLAPRIRLDGKRIDSSDIFNIEKYLFPEVQLYNTLISDGNVLSRLLTFSVNADGEITEIDTPTVAAGEGEGTMNATNILTDSLFTNIGYTFQDGQYIIDRNAEVYVVPRIITPTMSDTNVFYKTTAGEFSDLNRYTVQLYNVDKVNKSSLIVCYKDEDATELGKSPLILVDKVIKGLDDDENVSVMVCGYMRNKYVNFWCDTDITDAAKRVEHGDVIQCSMDGRTKTKIKKIEVRYKNDTEPTYYETSAFVSDTRTAIGRVVAKDADVITVACGYRTNGELDKDNAKPYNISTTYKMRCSDGETGIAETADFTPGSLVIMRMKRSNCEDIVLINE